MNKICLIVSLIDWVQVYMNKIVKSIQSTHINGGALFCSSVTTYLKLDSKGTQGNELYKVGGKRDRGSVM